MENLNTVISKNLIEIRRQKHLTLENLALLSGVSKAMIGQIERGESSPTVNILWKIASGLQVPLGTLIAISDPSATLVQIKKIHPIQDVEGLTVYPLFSFEQQRNLEIFSVTLAPNGSHVSDAHAPNSLEYVLLVSGCLKITIQDTTYDLSDGDALQFQTDHSHSYHNLLDTPAKFYCVLHHPKI